MGGRGRKTRKRRKEGGGRKSREKEADAVNPPLASGLVPQEDLQPAAHIRSSFWEAEPTTRHRENY